MQQFRFHVVSLPHTQVTKDYLSCAYTQKVRNFCKMMRSLGHIVYLYAGEETDTDVNEMITCIYKTEQGEYFGGTDTKKDFYPIEWKGTEPYWNVMNGRVITEMAKRVQDKDFICVIGGYCQKPIADAFPKHKTVEFGIGYQGFFSDYKVFESYAWMHYTYGLQVGMAPNPPAGHNKRYENGQSYDIVIPNYFEPEDFPYSEEKEDYCLYIGRLIPRKGFHVAVEACGNIGMKLKIAGQGIKEFGPGYIKTAEMELRADHIEYVGTVGKEERGKLMSKARAILVPTSYIEPFAGVHIEGMMSGTPVITTDWGVFPETVVDGFNGFRTRTLREIQEAIKKAPELDSKKIREYAIKNYSLDRVKYLYQAYFEQLYELWGDGWYSQTELEDYKRYQKI